MKRSSFFWCSLGLVVLGIAVLAVPVSTRVKETKPMNPIPPSRLDLSLCSSRPPGHPLNLLFIHHSCGGQLLAVPGPSVGENCIFLSHPNGGGLRLSLQQNGYVVHEASYGSKIGERTDVFDWSPKFRDQMDDIVRCDMQDRRYAGGQRNQIVVFKSCFPNNGFRGEGVAPGSPDGPELTVWNAKAAYLALLGEFHRQPEILFVCVTAPPLAPGKKSEPLWRFIAGSIKRSLRHESASCDLAASGPLARRFNSWLADTNGWLKDYDLKNVVVFDYYDILTGNGRSDFSMFATDGGVDSHPGSEGNEKAAETFVPFLNQAVRRAGLAE